MASGFYCPARETALIRFDWSVFMSDRDERPSPDPLVAGKGSKRLLCELRKRAKLLQEPLHAVRGEAAQTNETTAEISAVPITGIASTACSENRTKVHSSSLPTPKRAIKPSLIALRLLTPLVGQPLSARILRRLAQLEAAEPDVWLKDDLRIAWLCVLHASESKAHCISFKKARNYTPEPHGAWDYAFWRYLGQVPEKLIPLFCERARKHAEMEQATHCLVRQSADERPTVVSDGKQGEDIARHSARVVRNIEESSPAEHGAGQRRGVRGAEKSAPTKFVARAAAHAAMEGLGAQGTPGPATGQALPPKKSVHSIRLSKPKKAGAR